MFRKKYKDANKDIKLDESLKKNTIQKMKNIKLKRKRYSLSLGIGIIAFAMVVLVSSLFLKDKKIESYAIGIPEYPPKTGFEDYEREISENVKIDEKFIKNLNDFSIESSSLILSDGDRKTNNLYSPISLYMALAMVGETAEGETQEQIIDALSMDNIGMIRSETGKLFHELYFYNEIGRLTLGNSLWLNKDVVFNEDILEGLAKDYYAHSFILDFEDKDSPKKISRWVSDNTGGRLGNDSSDFSLDTDDVMMVISTISFYDEWIDSFDESKTEEDIFHLEDGNKVGVDFMNMEYGSHGFAHGDGYTVSSLDMKNNNSMVFILPDEGKSPYDIVSDSNVLKEAISALSSEESVYGEVVFKIPKFKFSSELKLNDFAKKLGIEDAFKESEANFTPLSETKPLFISGIKQSSFISIDEKGVEASAFTQIDYDGSTLPEDRADIILDRPFIFAITGMDNLPLFMGIIDNPSL